MPDPALNDSQTRTLAALLECMFPAGPDHPGADAIGATGYIVAALEGPYRGDADTYHTLLAALDVAAGGAFADAALGRRLELVAALESGTLEGLPAQQSDVFELVWRHLREGLFGDPVHGGNRNFSGWAAIGFPGAQTGYGAGDQVLDRPILKPPASLAALRERFGSKPWAPPAGPGPKEADVVIVGGGAVGGFLAHTLVRCGLRVVILEAGPARSGRERAMDEVLSTAFRNEGGAAKFNREVPTWRASTAQKATRARRSQGLETALGGNSVAWGAVAMRLYAQDFRVRSATIARYGQARIPVGSTLADWPLDYADLAPFYDEAEHLMGVSGQDGANPFEPPRNRPYAMPPLRSSGLGLLFGEAARAEGYHPFPLPAAIATVPYRGRAACTYCSFCSRFGCHVDAKASAQNTVLPDALATGRLHIATHARVDRIVTDESGRAVAVRYRGADGDMHQVAGGTIVLAANTFENVRLLLLNTDRRHARGLGNETGQVGRHYMTRQQPSVYGVFDHLRLNRFIGPTAQAMAIADLSSDHFDHGELDFILGGRIAAFNQYLPVEASGVLPPDVPRWGEAWRAFFTHAYNRTAMLFIDPEILPYETNGIDLDPDITDDLGRPVARITFDVHENERRLMAYLQERAARILGRMGASRIWRRPHVTVPISTHDVGGTRMGQDATGSVVDSFGRVHDTPGLMVLGGSTFVSLPAVNPALTIVALALRAGEQIAGARA
jgi:gluconate 2-dehydrogenase alpha chain